MNKIIRMDAFTSRNTTGADNIEIKPDGKIELFDVVKQFGSGGGNGKGKHRFTALDRISLSIELGRITVLKGPSGSGKTTLLTIIGCMSRPTAGRIYLGEQEITSLPERFLSRIRRKRFGFVFQNYNLIKGISVLENTMIPAYPMPAKSRQIRRRAMELLEQLKILSKANQKVELLSGGELQRAAIARALINNPDIIIADEPTAHLNTDLAVKLLDIMLELEEEGKTIVLASHDPLLYESNDIHGVIEMRDGRIVDSKTGYEIVAVGTSGGYGARSAHLGLKADNGKNRRSGKDRRLRG